MSFEKLGTSIHTAEDLFNFLKDIPVGLRTQLPIQVVQDEEVLSGTVNVEAYAVFETEGCLETGCRISFNPKDM